MSSKNVMFKLANKLWQFSNFPLNKKYGDAISKSEEVQRKYLFRLLQANTKSAYGKNWNFSSISSVKKFQERIPLTKYDDYEPYINRISKGEKAVLTNEKVFLFEPSSGSISSCKFIPYTRSLRREFHSAIAPWIFSLYRMIPKAGEGRAYWSISPRNRIQNKHGVIPVGFDRDASYLNVISRRFFSYISVEPDNVTSLNDIAGFRNQTLACLLSAEDLTLISIWSPSFLKILLDWYFEHDNEIFDLMKKRYPKIAHQRISDLKEIGKEQTVFEKIWPQLKVISCWTDATSQNEARRLKEYFPNTYIQGKGLVATEAFVSFPYAVEYDPVLAITSHFFEFMSEDGDCLLPHQVQKDHSYSVIVTTGGGFYRYQLEDQVLVTGFIGNTPTLRFLGKLGNISDKYGEKINSLHVARIIKSLFNHYNFNFCMLAPDSSADKRFYTLYIESEIPLSKQIANSLECKLRENYNYRYCVELGQLEPARIFRIAKDGYRTYEARCLERGQKQGNIKLTYLSTLDRWSDYFQGEYE